MNWKHFAVQNILNQNKKFINIFIYIDIRES